MFSDDICNSISITSNWKGNSKMVNSECQTNDDDGYSTVEVGCQSGEGTMFVERIVKAKDANASLLVFCKGRLKKYDESIWMQLFEQGAVTVGGDTATNPGYRVKADDVIAYTDCRKDMAIQTSSPNEKETGQLSDEADGKEEKKDEFEKDQQNSYNDIDSSKLLSFIKKVTPSVEACILSNNTSSVRQLFNNYPLSMYEEAKEYSSEAASYYKCFNLDINKFKIVFPNWNGKDQSYHNGVITRCGRTRVGDRVYDIQFQGVAKGRNKQGSDEPLKLMNVKEEYIRVPAGSVTGDKDSKSSTGSGQQLAVGLRVFALAPNRSGGSYYYHGSIEKCNKSTYDVRVTSTNRLLEGLTAKDITVGCYLQQNIEARQPYIAKLNGISISWNSSSSSVAVGYGNTTVDGWSDTPGCVAVWNINNNDVLTYYRVFPTYLLEYSASITVVKFHPERPSILAAGTLSGEIIIWDLSIASAASSSSRTSSKSSSSASSSVPFTNTAVEPVVVSVINEFSHKEPVTDIEWVVNPSGGSQSGGKTKRGVVVLPDDYNLLSVGADGKLLLWGLENRLAHPIKGFFIDGQADTSSRSNAAVVEGAMCMSIVYGNSTSVSQHDDDSGSVGGLIRRGALRNRKPKWLVVGLEGGPILKLSMAKLLTGGTFLTADSFSKASFAHEVYPSVNKLSQNAEISQGFRFDAHIGNVNSIDTSPFNSTLFVSAGNDGFIRLFHMNQRKPLRTFEPVSRLADGSLHTRNKSTYSSVSCVKFSPSKPTIIAACTSDGHLFLFDISNSFDGPIVTLDAASSSRSAQKFHQNYIAKLSEANTGNRDESATIMPPIDACGFTSLSFNNENPAIISACDVQGVTHMWKINGFLSVPSAENTTTTVTVGGFSYVQRSFDDELAVLSGLAKSMYA